MITTVYFVRHAEPDSSVSETYSRPLTEKGERDALRVSEFLRSANVTRVLSSPYKRAVDTVSQYSLEAGLDIEIVPDFREWSGGYIQTDRFYKVMQRMFADMSLKLADGESLGELQKRNIDALESAVSRYAGEVIAIGAHGIALAVTLNGLCQNFGYDDFCDMCERTPWIARLVFNDGKLCSYAAFDILSPYADDGFCRVDISPDGALNAYRFVVIFARHAGKWVYCRCKTRDCFETAGGHIENGETPYEAAKRELYEETGAVDFDIRPLFDYAVTLSHEYSYGKVFFADIARLGDMPPFEMAEIRLIDSLPTKMRFPNILPALFERVRALTAL